MKPVQILTLLISSAAICTTVNARSDFVGVAAKVLHFENIKGSSLERSDCLLCHVNPKGGAPWNSFGYAVGFWRGKKQNINLALYSALRYGGDSDYDGIPNTFEYLAGTNPSDKDSKPETKLDVLKSRYDSRGIFDADSDSDGYINALEVFAGTLPGDANSQPTEALENLKIRFDTAGGLEMFKVK